MLYHIDGLVQERCNSIVNALEFSLFCTNPSIYDKWRFFGIESSHVPLQMYKDEKMSNVINPCGQDE